MKASKIVAAATPRPPAALRAFLDHVDDGDADQMLVDLVADAMDAKLRKKRDEGRGGWHSPRPELDAVLMGELRTHLDKGDMIDVINFAGMIHVRRELYGHTAEPAKAPPPAKAKTARNVAKKKPAAKKRTSTTAAVSSKIATLKDLVAQAKPLFAANPKLDRQGLVNKIGRRYERLTTFDELRTLCAGKAVTTHSVKKGAKKERASEIAQEVLARPSGAAPAWPFPTGNTPPGGSASSPKPKRPRRDPASVRPVEIAESSIPKGVRTKPYPKLNAAGFYDRRDAEHAATFSSGNVSASFCAIETEDGWTTGCNVRIQTGPNPADDIQLEGPMNDVGPITPDPDTAIRDVTSDMLKEVHKHLADPKHMDRYADLEKLRTWLLGFQARGVEKVKHLAKTQQQLELAA